MKKAFLLTMIACFLFTVPAIGAAKLDIGALGFIIERSEFKKANCSDYSCMASTADKNISMELRPKIDGKRIKSI